MKQKLGLSNVNHERKHKLIIDLWILIMNTSNFTLYSILFIAAICKTFFILKLFLIEQVIILHSFVFI